MVTSNGPKNGHYQEMMMSDPSKEVSDFFMAAAIFAAEFDKLMKIKKAAQAYRMVRLDYPLLTEQSNDAELELFLVIDDDQKDTDV